MRAFVYGEGGVSRLVNDFRSPVARRDGAVIKVLACSVCGTDLRAWRHGNERITPPRITGHELCGEIVELGSDRRGFELGQRISMAPAIGCGACYPCSRGFTNLCDDLQTIGFQFDGGFAEYMAVPGSAFERGNVYRTPDGVPDEEAALAEPIACIVNGQEFLHIAPGDSVVIFGSGLHRLHARRAGAHEGRGPDHHRRAQRAAGGGGAGAGPVRALHRAGHRRPSRRGEAPDGERVART